MSEIGGPPGTKKSKPYKEAMAWALAKFGEAHVGLNASAEGVSLKKWALRQYLSADRSSDVAVEQFGNGTAQETSVEINRVVDEQPQPMTTADALTAVVASDAAEMLKRALAEFLDGPMRALMLAFVALYVSRKMSGDSDEAVLALDACRQVFDACGLTLTDVETATKRGKVTLVTSKAEQLTEPTSDDALATTVAPKEETPRERKNRLDRERRAAKKKQSM